MLNAGITLEQEKIVTAADTAAAIGSGGLPVFATPAMIALMEGTAMESVRPYLDGGQSTVGTSLTISHSAPTPVGMRVRCQSELTAIEGRRLTFSVAAFDESGPIGEGIHVRAIVDDARFMERVQAKLEGCAQ